MLRLPFSVSVLVGLLVVAQGFLLPSSTSRKSISGTHWMTATEQGESDSTAAAAKEEDQEEEKESLLLDRLGGPPALEAAVSIFYDRVVADPELERFFKGVDVDALRDHQYQFMEIAFTKIPEDLDVVAYISDAHARLLRKEGLNESHFDLVAGHLVGTLQGLGVQQAEIDSVVATVGPLRGVFEQAAKEATADDSQQEE
ncbi:truncated hemoglobin GlbN [Seminavis robusta]|uniref:Truncated hemoglobin GlbN n=1 Tax=Seminavis robusta TaxID=568900 RepID=A0A9N8D838_9STRA|nr:truncated hemoglobin GlbN [Seminavis robusta]|eukprot:Sro26_g017880.1 truncated hemoglobin GlbN (200) ;mRNA; r:145515-146114